MLKKTILVTLLLSTLCGCQPSTHTEIGTRPSNSKLPTTEITPAETQATTVVETFPTTKPMATTPPTVPPETTYTQPATVPTEPTVPSSPPVTEPEQPEHSYPIVICENNTAYIIGAVADGVVYTPWDFLYNGKTLDAYFGLLEAVAVSSNIIDTERTICFYDANGDRKSAHVKNVTAQGEYATGVYWLRAELSEAMEQNICIGTYGDVDILPRQISAKEQAIFADMDGDGQTDVVSWAFGQQPDGDWHILTVTIETDGKTYTISKDSELFAYDPGTKVLLADIDLDGYLDVVVYECIECDFYRGVSIFQFVDGAYVELLTYSICEKP